MKRTSVPLFVSVLLAMASMVATSCGDDETSPRTLASVATYNLGLADNYVPLVEERLPPLISYIDATSFDVMCLTEVWAEEDVLAIAESASTPYPSYFWVDTTEDPQPPACTEELVADLRTCAEAADCENDPAGLVNCAASNCGDEIDDLTAASPACLTCLASQLEAETLSEMMTVCVEEGGGTFSQGGRNGLLLLSRDGLAETDSLLLTSFLIRRVALYAQVELPDLGTTHVVCTHVNTPVAGVNYSGEYDSWEDEQANQIQDILAWIDEKVGGGPIVFMGDFNNSPAIGDDLVARYPENYQLVIDAGFVDPYASAADVECTWCDDNTLVEEADSRVIDHIFMRGMPDDVQYVSERFADQLVEIQVDGSPQDSNLSDHFGVAVDIVR